MLDAETLAQINGEYAIPPDAGPAWRYASAYGFDMSIIEESLVQTPDERLDAHQRALDLILELKQAGKRHGAE